ncbi:MAG: serine/threonine-protein kinase [Polyangia bacterium]|nr:serine/threonine-protein kinase [Polyangia bacterium]
MGKPCPHCPREHDPDALFCPVTGKAISVSRIDANVVIDGKYRVLRRLASGGMGAVYEVLHERIGRRLAMKLILPELAQNEEVARRFELEARAASAIGHANIVEITDMGTTREGLPFLVMEFLDGCDLSVLLEPGLPLPLPRAKHILAQTLSALGAAHGAGIIHRDLKPENVFLIQRGEDADFVKLLDFGISKIAGGEEAKLHLTSTGLILGTPYYMSPEQARGDKELDHRSDLFAAGTILYQMLTGRRPFAGENLNQLLYQILRCEIPPPRQFNPEIPAPMERVVLKALAMAPEHRFPDAESFRAALLGEREVATRELPPARLPPASQPAADPYSATLIETGENPSLVQGTPMAWSGSRKAPARGRGRMLWAIGVAATAALAAVVFALVMGNRREPSEGPAKAPPAALGTDGTPADARAIASPREAERPREPGEVRVELKLDPASAKVELDQREVTDRPLTLPRSDGRHQLRVSAPDYEPQTIEIHARADQTLVVLLRPSKATPRPGMRQVQEGMKRIKAYDEL